MKDTPANSRHYHRPVVTVADRVALAYAEGDDAGRSPPSHVVGDRLGLKSPHVRAAWATVKRRLGPQAC